MNQGRIQIERKSEPEIYIVGLYPDGHQKQMRISPGSEIIIRRRGNFRNNGVKITNYNKKNNNHAQSEPEQAVTESKKLRFLKLAWTILIFLGVSLGVLLLKVVK